MRPRYSSVAVRQPARQIAGAVQPRAGAPNGSGDEALRGQLGPVEIAARHAGAADVHLARHADRHRLSRARRARTAQVGDRPPITLPRAGARVRRVERPVGHVHGRLGDAVHVDQPRRWSPCRSNHGRERCESSASPPKIT